MPVEDVLVVDDIITDSVTVAVGVAVTVAVLTLVDTCAVDSAAPEYSTRQYVRKLQTLDQNIPKSANAAVVLKVLPEITI
jgi:hypothetical protein